ncbi:hypothetical protein RO3G_09060 [Rhizopus delemar RA 99-880]|uniref:Carbohydrate kinase PfkB domain-containing protein n=1 Tax=Rhizopus delemar (strain RA 99-880 / ATCC MYA-4621 / FGSC 9543 / NRRL 43880) TaxID=246409 RepID=I1C7C0_RHIO9|nr:hypothetical protein RO3G_09060 [Rhizopus delemar RA 99-880]|eukprot:EIE84350.1 hypothetical protein RO3G_09060 [Rhizopus delemar RA 99-880]
MSALGPQNTSNALLEELESKGIKTSTCLFRKEPTPSSYIIQSSKTGSRTIISCNTIQDIKKDEFIGKIETFFKDAPLSWVHFEGRNVEEAGDVVFFSKLYAEKRGYEEPTRFLRDFQAKCQPEAVLFCTWGANGATSLHHQNIHSSPAPYVQRVVDTIGAGDTFIAGVIFYLCHGYNVRAATEFACRIASKKVSQYGFAI